MHTKTVLEVIANRMFAKNSGIPYKDDYKLCLAVEGGAMRGIISFGMLIALYDLDILDVFDDYIGVSSGSLNLGYTLTGQAALGLSVYFEDMESAGIVNLLRFRSKEHPIMDLRKLYDHTTIEKQLDLVKLQEKYSESYKICVTNVTKNIGEIVNLHLAGHRLQEFLMAGAILPFIAGEPWIIKGNEYYDGGLHYIDPSQAAAEIHATHTFVLNTRPIGTKLKPWSGLVERKFKSLDENYPGAGTHYLECLKNYCEVYNDLPYGATELNGMQMYRHATEHSTGVNRLTMDQEKLTEGVKAGYKSILDIFYQQGRVGMLPSLM